MRTPIIGIYKITSPTERIYIGQSWDVKRRWGYHKNDRKSNGLLQRSIKKHGFSAHVFEVLVSLPATTTQDILNGLERVFIQGYKDQGASLLNLTEGGYNASPSSEHRERIRRALMGIKRSDETRRRISESKKGTVHTEEHKRLVSQRMKGRPATWLRGKKLLPEHVEKIRIASTGRKHTEEFKHQISARNKEIQHIIHSPEARAKRAAKLAGRKLSPERRENMRLAQLRRWENWRAAHA